MLRCVFWRSTQRPSKAAVLTSRRAATSWPCPMDRMLSLALACLAHVSICSVGSAPAQRGVITGGRVLLGVAMWGKSLALTSSQAQDFRAFHDPWWTASAAGSGQGPCNFLVPTPCPLALPGERRQMMGVEGPLSLSTSSKPAGGGSV